MGAGVTGARGGGGSGRGARGRSGVRVVALHKHNVGASQTGGVGAVDHDRAVSEEGADAGLGGSEQVVVLGTKVDEIWVIPSAPLNEPETCEVGDLAGKHGKIPVAAKEGGMLPPPQVSGLVLSQGVTWPRP